MRTRAAGLVFALLLAPASASAECAWVLWFSYMSEKTAQMVHFPSKAYEAKAECERA